MSKLLTEEFMRRLSYLETLAPGHLTVELINKSDANEYCRGYAHLTWDSPLRMIGTIVFVFPRDETEFIVELCPASEALPPLKDIGRDRQGAWVPYNHPPGILRVLEGVQQFAVECLPQGFTPNPHGIDITDLTIPQDKIEAIPLMSLIFPEE